MTILTDNTDVTISSPIDNQLLKYVGGQWVNWTPDYITASFASGLYAPIVHTHSQYALATDVYDKASVYTKTATYTKAEVDAIAAGITPGGGGGSTNADFLDGQDGTYYLDWANFTGTPTTLAGYGILDAALGNHNHDGTYAKLTGATFTGVVRNNTSGYGTILKGGLIIKDYSAPTTNNNVCFYGQNGYVYFRAGGVDESTTTNDLLGLKVRTGGAWNDVWHAGNFDPTTKADLSGSNSWAGNNEFYSTDATGDYPNSGVEIREYNAGGIQTGVDAEAPAIAFHWYGRHQQQIALHNDGSIAFRDGTTHAIDVTLRAGEYAFTTGAVFQDLGLNNILGLKGSSTSVGLRMLTNGINRGAFYANSSNHKGFLDENGNWQLQLKPKTSGYMQFYGSSTGVANMSYLSFAQSDGTQDGYIGVGSSSSGDMIMAANGGHVQLRSPAGYYSKIYYDGVEKFRISSASNNSYQDLDMRGNNIDMTYGASNVDFHRSGWITFYGEKSTYHSIGSRDVNGAAADDIRLNSYGSFIVNLDSNDNNTDSADFIIGRHGANTGVMSDVLLTVNGETGSISTIGSVRSTKYGQPISPRWDTSFFVLQANYWYAHGNTDLMYLGESGNTVYVRGTFKADNAIEANGGLKQDGDTILNGTDTWLRTTGQTGWYSTTYGGGIYMVDASYVRTYGNKNFYATNTASNAIRVGGGISFDNANGNGLRFWSSDVYKIYMSSTSGEPYGVTELDAAGDYNMYFRMNTANRGFVFYNLSNSATAAAQITGAGDIHARGTMYAVDFELSSDRDLKSNIVPLSPDDGLKMALSLNPVTHEWKDKERGEGQQYGYIAQELATKHPSLAHKNGEHWVANYIKVVPILNAAIKKQQSRIERLEALVEELIHG